MDREGSSRVCSTTDGEFQRNDHFQQHRDDERPERSEKAEKAEKLRKEKERQTREEEDPEDTDDEERLAESAGSRVYPTELWKRLKATIPKDSFTIDMIEIKMNGEILTMRFVAEGKNHEMYFTPRSTVDFKLRRDYWIPREHPMYKALRTRLYSLPKSTTINKLVIYNTPNCEAEDCIIEFMFIKKWLCKQFEYNICTEFYQPEHLRKLIHMFKPSDIIIFLNFGPFLHNSQTGHEPQGMHNHLAALSDGRIALERDFRVDCTHALNTDPTKKELNLLYAEAGKGKAFGMQMIRTLISLRKFVSMMVEKRMAQTKGMAVRKFIVNGPTTEKICSKLQTLLKDDGPEEATKKRAAYAAGDKMFVCVRNDLRRAFKYSLSMPATAFKMAIGNEQFLHYTRSVANFQCLFRTTVDEQGVKQFIQEWIKGDRHIEEIQLHVDKVFESDFANQFHPDTSDPKRIKIRRCLNERRSTMYIERDRLATRHLSLRVLDNSK